MIDDASAAQTSPAYSVFTDVAGAERVVVRGNTLDHHGAALALSKLARAVAVAFTAVAAPRVSRNVRHSDDLTAAALHLNAPVRRGDSAIGRKIIGARVIDASDERFACIGWGAIDGLGTLSRHPARSLLALNAGAARALSGASAPGSAAGPAPAARGDRIIVEFEKFLAEDARAGRAREDPGQRNQETGSGQSSHTFSPRIC
ncbi:MAG: hypothetical protein HUU21_06480 [Polyangiaceae bacterium]|nr:hypothetical protein [Polyangiaceae bacterium]